MDILARFGDVCICLRVFYKFSSFYKSAFLSLEESAQQMLLLIAFASKERSVALRAVPFLYFKSFKSLQLFRQWG